MLCHAIQDVMSCYITFYVMLCCHAIQHVMSCYITFYVILCLCNVMLYSMT